SQRARMAHSSSTGSSLASGAGSGAFASNAVCARANCCRASSKRWRALSRYLFASCGVGVARPPIPLPCSPPGPAPLEPNKPVIGFVLVPRQRPKDLADFVVFFRMVFKQREGQAVACCRRVLVPAELAEELPKARGREGVVLLAVSLARALQEHVGLLIAR